MLSEHWNIESQQSNFCWYNLFLLSSIFLCLASFFVHSGFIKLGPGRRTKYLQLFGASLIMFSRHTHTGVRPNSWQRCSPSATMAPPRARAPRAPSPTAVGRPGSPGVPGRTPCARPRPRRPAPAAHTHVAGRGGRPAGIAVVVMMCGAAAVARHYPWLRHAQM